MRIIEKLKLIERIDQLIRMKSTGTARELASRVNISKSSVYYILELMKTMGAEIEYCNVKRSYFYTQNKTLAIGFIDQAKIKGGKSGLSKIFGQYKSIFENIACMTGNSPNPLKEEIILK